MKVAWEPLPDDWRERDEGGSKKSRHSPMPISTGAASSELFYKLEFHVGIGFKRGFPSLKKKLSGLGYCAKNNHSV